MKIYLIPLIIGILCGIIDIIPMIVKKLDKYSIKSAFIFHLIMPFLLFNLNINILWWLKGGVLYLICSLPIAILVLKHSKKDAGIIIINSLVIGELVGIFMHYFL